MLNESRIVMNNVPREQNLRTAELNAQCRSFFQNFLGNFHSVFLRLLTVELIAKKG